MMDANEKLERRTKKIAGHLMFNDDDHGAPKMELGQRRSDAFSLAPGSGDSLHLSPVNNAIGATEDSGKTTQAIGGSGSENPYEIELEFVDLDGIDEIPLVGSDADISEDYVAGLMKMASRVNPKTKLGYVDTSEAGHVLLCVKPDATRRVLGSSVQHFLGGLRPPSAAFFGPKVLFILEGKEWLDLRNVLKKAFQKHNVRKMNEQMNVSASRLLSLIDRYATSGKHVDLMRLFACYHLSAIGNVSFGVDLSNFDRFEDGPNEIEQSFEFLLEELPRRAFAPDWDTQNDFESDTPENRNMRKYSEQARHVIRKTIQQRLLNLQNGGEKPQDLLQSMMDVYTADYPESKDNVEVLTQELGDNLIEIVFAGYNTTVPTLSHVFYFLANHPHYLQRVRDEVDTVCGDRMPTDGDLKKLQFIQCCVQEGLRLCPPASLIARQLTKDIEVDGLIIPRATRVWLPACYIHRDPDTWKNPNSFEPERFLKKIVRGSFIPFSDGARNCAGRNFAMAEAVTAIALITRRYNISVSPDYRWTTVFTGFGLRPYDLNTARVCTRVVFSKREQL